MVGGGNVTVIGEARPGATVEFFKAAADPSGYGEGQTFIGSAVVSGATPGLVDPTASRFSYTFTAGSLAVGDRITATATDPDGNTSEFSLNVVASVLGPGVIVLPSSGLTTTETGGSAAFSVVLSTQPTADVTIAAFLERHYGRDGCTGLADLHHRQLERGADGGGDRRVGLLSDGNVAYTIVLSAAVSADPAYQGIDPADVSVTNLDGVNDAPVNSVPGTQTTPEDTTLVFSSGNGNAISIADVDAGTNPMQVTLTASQGTISLASNTGLVFTLGDGAADGAMTFTGTVVDINAALQGMSFAPSANFSGIASLTITTSDLGGSGSGGAKTDTDTVNITVGRGQRRTDWSGCR